MTGPSVDGVLVQWGEPLFYPSNRIVASREARLRSGVGPRAAAIRDRIRATVVRRAPQVMVKVTGGGRGMAAIAAHFRYIAKGGRLPFEDDRGVVSEGKEALRDLVWQWQHGGSYGRRVIGARPSTSCCRCRAGWTPRPCNAQRASSRWPSPAITPGSWCCTVSRPIPTSTRACGPRAGTDSV